jgi:exoribonuclease-2
MSAHSTPWATDDLAEIARHAMIERGPAARLLAGGAGRDERSWAPTRRTSRRGARPGELLWCSIDNDDSKDLDQLTVAEPLAGGAVACWSPSPTSTRLVKAGSATDAHARRTPPRSTPRRHLPDAARAALDRPHLAGRSAAAHGDVVDMTVGADGAVTRSDVYPRAACAAAPSSPTTASPPGSTGGPAPRKLAAVPGSTSSCGCRTASRQSMQRLRRQRGALSLARRRRGRCSTGVLLGPARRREEPREGADRRLHDRGQRRDGALPRAARVSVAAPAAARRERWERIVELAPDLGEQLPHEPTRRPRGLPRRRAAADPGALRRRLAVGGQAARLGEYMRRSRGRAGGPLRPGVSDYTHSTAPNRRFPDL